MIVFTTHFHLLLYTLVLYCYTHLYSTVFPVDFYTLFILLHLLEWRKLTISKFIDNVIIYTISHLVLHIKYYIQRLYYHNCTILHEMLYWTFTSMGGVHFWCHEIWTPSHNSKLYLHLIDKVFLYNFILHLHLWYHGIILYDIMFCIKQLIVWGSIFDAMKYGPPPIIVNSTYM